MAATDAGSVITQSRRSFYSDETGENYTTVLADVLPLRVLGGCDSDSHAGRDCFVGNRRAPRPITRLFGVCNTGKHGGDTDFAHPVQCHGAGDPDRAVFR